MTDLKELFVDSVETPFTANHKWFMTQLKSTSASASTSVTQTSLSSRLSLHRKREPVNLPWFYGDPKKLPFLAYPTWKAEWDVLIVNYEEKTCPTVLKDHL